LSDVDQSSQSYDAVVTNIQKEFDDMVDELWLLVDPEETVQLRDVISKIRKIFNFLFQLLDKQKHEIDCLKEQIEPLIISSDELFRFINRNEHPSIAACKPLAELIQDSQAEQLRQFIMNHGFQFNDICLAIRILKKNRNTTAYPCNPSTTCMDLRSTINRLFISNENPKKSMLKMQWDWLNCWHRNFRNLFFKNRLSFFFVFFLFLFSIATVKNKKMFSWPDRYDQELILSN